MIQRFHDFPESEAGKVQAAVRDQYLREQLGDLNELGERLRSSSEQLLELADRFTNARLVVSRRLREALQHPDEAAAE